MAQLNFVDSNNVRVTTKTYGNQQRAVNAVKKELEGLALTAKVNVHIREEQGRFIPVLMPTSKLDVNALLDTGFELHVPRNSAHERKKTEVAA